VLTLTCSVRLQNKRLSALVRSGIAFHHAGLSQHDRHTVESLFLSGDVAVLCECLLDESFNEYN
jgi:ATP-dependent DNA helicase HFM1/MER3